MLKTSSLENQHVILRAFEVDTHGPMLRAMLGDMDDQLTHWPFRGPGDWIGGWLSKMRQQTLAGQLVSFAVFRRQDQKFVGLTAFLSPDLRNRSVEIGSTIYRKDVHGTVVSPAATALMLKHAFDKGIIRVRFHVDTRYNRTQAALKKLGAVKEGVLRNHRVLPDGSVRDTIVYSIITSDWPSVRENLDRRLQTQVMKMTG